MSEADYIAGRLGLLLARRTLPANALVEGEWERLVKLAIRHGLGPLLYARLRERPIPPPPGIAAQLRNLYLASAARNIRLFHELGRTLGAFRAQAIPVIPLKGACLAEAGYGDVALRPMADVDLLVRSSDMDHALGVLRTHGYDSEKQIDTVAAQTFSHDMPLMFKAGCVPVEMHWTIANPSYPGGFRASDLKDLWSRAQPVVIAGVSVQMLCPTDLMLHLCRHAAIEHHFSGVRLRSFVDIGQVVQRYGDAIEWDAFTTRANQWGIGSGVHLALQLAEEWTDFVCPPTVSAGLKAESLDDRGMEWVKYKILSESSADLDSPAVRFAGDASVSRHLAALRTALSPSGDAIANVCRAPSTLWPVVKYYLGRPGQLWHDHGHVLWRILRRDGAFLPDARKEAHLREYLGWR